MTREAGDIIKALGNKAKINGNQIAIDYYRISEQLIDKKKILQEAGYVVHLCKSKKKQMHPRRSYW